MPVLDMPLEQLQSYMGRNPKPQDFDTYWEQALQELAATPPAAQRVASEFQVPGVECFDVWFTGVGGARIHAAYMRPAQAQAPHPAVLQFHGYRGNAGLWCDKMGYVAMGYSIAAMDCRGQGGSSEDNGTVRGNTHHGHIIRGLDDAPEKLLFRQIFLDTVQLANVVMAFEEVDENRVGVLGGSQGGALALACAALHPGIRCVASMYPFLSDYRRVWEMDLAQDAYQELRDYFRLFDPRHQREQEIFTKLGYIDIQHLAPRIEAQVLMATALMDSVCPPSTQFAAYNKITSAKDMVIYPDYGHEYLPGFLDDAMQFMLGL